MNRTTRIKITYIRKKTGTYVHTWVSISTQALMTDTNGHTFIEQTVRKSVEQVCHPEIDRTKRGNWFVSYTIPRRATQ